MEYIFIFFLLILFLILGTPLYIGIFITTLAGTLLFLDMSPVILMQQTFGGMDSFVLMAMPFFLLSANAMDAGGLSSRIINLAHSLLGHVNGGLAITTQAAATAFGSLSGSGPATVASIGKIMYPELVKDGYDKGWASALITQSGSISLVIPPSITLIIYSSVTNVSIADLFMAGLGAGIFFALVTLIYIYIYAKKHGKTGTEKRTPFTQVLKSIKSAGWALLVPIIIIGGIFSGVFTATEAGAIAAVYSIFIGAFIYKEITFKKLYTISLATAKTTASLLILMGVSEAFSGMLVKLQFAQILTNFLTNYLDDRILFLLFLNLLLLVLGMFLDSTLALVVITPLVLPTAISLGIDPVHLGVVIILNLAIGQFTPPFGLNIFVGQAVTGAPVVAIWKKLIPFSIISIIALLFVTYIPKISMQLVHYLN